MDICPSEEHLARFVEGACDAEQTVKLGRHIRHCPQCSAWILQAEINNQVLAAMHKAARYGPTENRH